MWADLKCNAKISQEGVQTNSNNKWYELTANPSKILLGFTEILKLDSPNEVFLH